MAGTTPNYQIFYPQGNDNVEPVGPNGNNGQYFSMAQSIEDAFNKVNEQVNAAATSASTSASAAQSAASSATASETAAQAAQAAAEAIPAGHSNVGYDTDGTPYIIDQSIMPVVGTGSPLSVITPASAGQEYTDTAGTDGNWKWIATGTTSADWVVTINIPTGA